MVFAFSKFINSSNLANEKSNGLGFGIPKPAWKDIRESGKEYIKDLVARVQTAMSARATKKDDW